MEVKFLACEHLDYEPHYGPCKRQLISCNGTKMCWKRAMNGDLAQFCKKRGRINSPVDCLDKDNAGCLDYTESEHTIDVSQEEIDS